MNVSGSKRQLQEERVAFRSETHAKEAPLWVGGELAKLVQIIQESIARRAYELVDSRGCEAGQALADWFQAEGEITHPLNKEITESRDKVKVRAAVSGFRAEVVSEYAATRVQ